jgi:hypothetical protein
MQKSFFLITMLAFTLMLAAAPVALAQSDPEAILNKHGEACVRQPRALTRPQSRRSLSAEWPTSSTSPSSRPTSPATS